MDINFMRRLDYWIGIPLCFALSVFYKIQKIFIPEGFKQTNPKKILFLELSEMGSAILAYTAIEKVRQAHRDAQLYFWIFRRNQDSVHILNIMPRENVITMRDENLLSLLIDTARNLWRIRKERIDVVFDMELFSRFSSILSYLSGARTRVGFYRFNLEGLYRGNLHTHKVSYNTYMHISKNFLSLVQSLQSDPQERPLLKMPLTDYGTTVPKLKSSREEIEYIWQRLKRVNSQICESNRIVILNPGVNDILPLRRWPIGNYIELAKRLLTDPHIFIVIIGIDSKSCDGKVMCQEIPNPRLINFMGETSVKELIDLYNISELLISHDSGATNLASLTDIDTVVLFGPETPALYVPLSSNKTVLYSNLACSPCVSAYNHRHSPCRDNRCLKMITVDAVYTAARRYIEASS